MPALIKDIYNACPGESTTWTPKQKAECIHNKPLKKGMPVYWTSPFDGPRTGTYVGPVPAWNPKAQCCYIDSHNGRVIMMYECIQF